jgi:hypothetical protein
MSPRALFLLAEKTRIWADKLVSMNDGLKSCRTHTTCGFHHVGHFRLAPDVARFFGRFCNLRNSLGFPPPSSGFLLPFGFRLSEHQWNQ